MINWLKASLFVITLLSISVGTPLLIIFLFREYGLIYILGIISIILIIHLIIKAKEDIFND